MILFLSLSYFLREGFKREGVWIAKGTRNGAKGAKRESVWIAKLAEGRESRETRKRERRRQGSAGGNGLPAAKVCGGKGPTNG